MKYILMTLMSIIILSVTGCGDDTEDTAAADTAALDAGAEESDGGSSDTGAADDQDGGSDDE